MEYKLPAGRAFATLCHVFEVNGKAVHAIACGGEIGTRKRKPNIALP